MAYVFYCAYIFSRWCCACRALTHNSMLVQFCDNLTARLQLLGQLHMKLPEDLNAAEQQLRDGDLPELDEQTQLLKKQIQVVTALHHMSSMCLHPTCSGHFRSRGPHFYYAATDETLMLQITAVCLQTTVECASLSLCRSGLTVQSLLDWVSAPASI